MSRRPVALATQPKRGEVWFVDFDPKKGAEMGSVHPAIVMSRDDTGKLPLRVIVPITTFQPQFEGVPWMVELDATTGNGLSHKSVADCFQPRSFDLSRFIRRAGQMDTALVDKVARTVADVLGAPSEIRCHDSRFVITRFRRQEVELPALRFHFGDRCSKPEPRLGKPQNG